MNIKIGRHDLDGCASRHLQRHELIPHHCDGTRWVNLRAEPAAKFVSDVVDPISINPDAVTHAWPYPLWEDGAAIDTGCAITVCLGRADTCLPLDLYVTVLAS